MGSRINRKALEEVAMTEPVKLVYRYQLDIFIISSDGTPYQPWVTCLYDPKTRKTYFVDDSSETRE